MQKFLDLVKRNGENVMEVIDSFAASNNSFSKLMWKINKVRSIADDKVLSLKYKYWEIAKESGI